MAIGAGCSAQGNRDVELERQGEEEVLVVTVRPTRSRQGRCGRCGVWAPRYDNGEGSRRCQDLDAGTMRVYLQAAAPRVRCATHGVVVAAVPWARHRSRFTSAFEGTVAWLAASLVTEALAVAREVGRRSNTDFRRSRPRPGSGSRSRLSR